MTTQQISLTTISPLSQSGYAKTCYRKIIKDGTPLPTRWPKSLSNVMKKHKIPYTLQNLYNFLRMSPAPAILYSHLGNIEQFIGARNKTNLDDGPNHYLPIDIDSFNTDTPCSDAEIFLQVDSFIAQLPTEFHNVNYIVQLSSSFGLPSKSGLRAHLFFLLHPSTPLTAREAKFLNLPNTDQSIYKTTQPIFVQPPIFDNSPDPLTTPQFTNVTSRWLISKDKTQNALKISDDTYNTAQSLPEIISTSNDPNKESHNPVINTFNKTVDWDDLLANHQITKADNNLYISPFSTSGSPGIKIDPDDDKIYSFSDSTNEAPFPYGSLSRKLSKFEFFTNFYANGQYRNALLIAIDWLPADTVISAQPREALLANLTAIVEFYDIKNPSPEQQELEKIISSEDQDRILAIQSIMISAVSQEYNYSWNLISTFLASEAYKATLNAWFGIEGDKVKDRLQLINKAPQGTFNIIQELYKRFARESALSGKLKACSTKFTSAINAHCILNRFPKGAVKHVVETDDTYVFNSKTGLYKLYKKSPSHFITEQTTYKGLDVETSVKDQIKKEVLSAIPDDFEYNRMNTPDNSFPFRSGLFTVRKNSNELRWFRPTDNATDNKMTQEYYDPKAKNPYLEDLIAHWVQYDADRIRDLKLIMAYALTSGNPKQLIVVLKGRGGSGKSTCLQLLNNFLSAMNQAVNTKSTEFKESFFLGQVAQKGARLVTINDIPLRATDKQTKNALEMLYLDSVDTSPKEFNVKHSKKNIEASVNFKVYQASNDFNVSEFQSVGAINSRLIQFEFNGPDMRKSKKRIEEIELMMFKPSERNPSPYSSFLNFFLPSITHILNSNVIDFSLKTTIRNTNNLKIINPIECFVKDYFDDAAADASKVQYAHDNKTKDGLPSPANFIFKKNFLAGLRAYIDNVKFEFDLDDSWRFATLDDNKIMAAVKGITGIGQTESIKLTDGKKFRWQSKKLDKSVEKIIEVVAGLRIKRSVADDIQEMKMSLLNEHGDKFMELMPQDDMNSSQCLRILFEDFDEKLNGTDDFEADD